MYIDDGTAGDSGEMKLDIDGHEYVEQETYAYDGTGGVLDGVSTDHDITVDTPTGAHDIGPATIDTNDDGHPDTAIVHDANGDTVLYTDSHGDGRADVATEFTPDGQVVIADDAGTGEWTEVEHGHLTPDGAYQRDGGAAAEFTPPVGADDKHWAANSDDSGWAAAFSDAGSAQGVVRIDATTGQWISRN
ncbi:MAG TPA: hypothetical protein VGL06_12790 [Pseudonocardiaceae bacterium]